MVLKKPKNMKKCPESYLSLERCYKVWGVNHTFTHTQNEIYHLGKQDTEIFSPLLDV